MSIDELNIDGLPRPVVLDLFCGGGGAGTGLLRGGFKTVVGVDNADHSKSYVHEAGMIFLKMDVFHVKVEDVQKFDFIWASPPCQFASTLVNNNHRLKFQDKWVSEGKHINLIDRTRSFLVKTNVPFVMENVGGAKKYLKDPFCLCGTMFNLGVFRHRFFESNITFRSIPKCDHTNKKIGKLLNRFHTAKPRQERYMDDEAKNMKAGEAPDGFVSIGKTYQSHGSRIYYTYVGKTPQQTEKIKEMYGRTYARSLKEILRVCNRLCPKNTTGEDKNTKTEYKQMYPVYGLCKTRGTTEQWKTAMGIDWDMNRSEIRESIPPAYSKWIAIQFLLYMTNQK